MAPIVLNSVQLNEVIEALKKESAPLEEKKEVDEDAANGGEKTNKEEENEGEEEDKGEETNMVDGEVNKDGRRSRMLVKLKEIRKRYTSSFTMHALDHIINGTRFEKVR